MKKSGILVLLLMCFLVSALAVAEPFGVSNGIALDPDFEETKIAYEEVIAVSGDVTAFSAAPPLSVLSIRPLEVVCFPTEAGFITVLPSAGIEAGFIEADYIICFNRLPAKVTNSRDAGGDCFGGMINLSLGQVIC